MEKAVIITRIRHGEKQILGEGKILLMPGFMFKTLELPWLDNKNQISCIPAGDYEVQKHISPTFGQCFKIIKVEKRFDILIHYGNTYKNTKGCILVGREYADINGDKLDDVTDSRDTLKKMLELLPDKFTMSII